MGKNAFAQRGFAIFFLALLLAAGSAFASCTNVGCFIAWTTPDATFPTGSPPFPAGFSSPICVDETQDRMDCTYDAAAGDCSGIGDTRHAPLMTEVIGASSPSNLPTATFQVDINTVHDYDPDLPNDGNDCDGAPDSWDVHTFYKIRFVDSASGTVVYESPSWIFLHTTTDPDPATARASLTFVPQNLWPDCGASAYCTAPSQCDIYVLFANVKIGFTPPSGYAAFASKTPDYYSGLFYFTCSSPPPAPPADLINAEPLSTLADPTVGIPFDVILRIRNTAPAGSMSSNDATTEVLLDGTMQAFINTQALAAGADDPNAPVIVQLTCPFAGPHTVTVRVDSSGGTPESDEANNIETKAINCIPNAAPNVCTSSLDSMQYYAFLAVLAAIFFVGLAYMAGQAIGSPRVTTWAKSEAWQVVASVLIALGCIVAINIFCIVTPQEVVGMTPLLPSSLNLARSFGPAAAGDMYSASIEYLGGVASYVRGVVVAARYNMGVYELRSSKSIYRCDVFCLLSSVGHNFNPYSGETAYISVFSTVLNVATVSLLAVIFQIFTLQYIAGGIFTVMLPLAIVVRSIPFLRPFGGSLVAIFLALYIFYPVMIVFGGMLLPPVTWGMGVSLPNRITDHPAISDVLGPVNSAPSLQTEENTVNTYFDVEGRQRDDMTQLIKLGGIAFFAGVFMPALGFIVIAAIARETARLIGEDVDIGRLGQMI